MLTSLQPTHPVHVRRASTTSRPELLASARRRIGTLAEVHGIDSDPVRAALARWERILNAPATGDDVMALVDATLVRSS